MILVPLKSLINNWDFNPSDFLWKQDLLCWNDTHQVLPLRNETYGFGMILIKCYLLGMRLTVLEWYSSSVTSWEWDLRFWNDTHLVLLFWNKRYLTKEWVWEWVSVLNLKQLETHSLLKYHINWHNYSWLKYILHITIIKRNHIIIILLKYLELHVQISQ